MTGLVIISFYLTVSSFEIARKAERNADHSKQRAKDKKERAAFAPVEQKASISSITKIS